MPNVTQLMELAASGDRLAADELFELVYSELRKLAGSQMQGEAKGHTLQSTALVHEVWLKLIGSQKDAVWKNREHFFAAAAQAMRRILVDSARARNRQKRGGGQQKLELHENDAIFESDLELLALDEALKLFRDSHEVKAKLVELRFFAGLTNAQAAEQLGISTASAERYWTFAKAWLRSRMTP